MNPLSLLFSTCRLKPTSTESAAARLLGSLGVPEDLQTDTQAPGSRSPDRGRVLGRGSACSEMRGPAFVEFRMLDHLPG